MQSLVKMNEVLAQQVTERITMCDRICTRGGLQTCIAQPAKCMSKHRIVGLFVRPLLTCWNWDHVPSPSYEMLAVLLDCPT